MATKTFFYYGFTLLSATAMLFSSCEKEDEKNVPELTTAEVTEITQTSAISGGSITDDGGATVTARGVCWSTSQNPTINDNKTEDGSGEGSFASSLTDLQPNTTYYIRAYATNSMGTAYGNVLLFTTDEEINLPTITTSEVTEITRTTAVSGGNIADDGGAIVTERGVCWSTGEEPTINDNKTEDGSGSGSFTSIISGLEPNTTYYLRAYAINESGTAYGEQQVFTTIPPLSWVITNFTEDDGLISNSVYSLAVDNSNNIWAGTGTGLAKFDGLSWTNYTTADGLVDNIIRAISIDPDGNLWIGTSNGVSRFDGQTWTNYTEEDGLFNNLVYSIHADNHGNVWIGTRNNHVTVFNGTTFNSFAVNPQTNPEGTIMGHVHAIHADHNGNLWFGSCYTGLSMYDGDNWTHDINNLRSFVNTIFCTSDGDIWLGQSPLGAFRYSNGSWDNYPEGETMIKFVYTVGEDSIGNIWIGGRDGVSVFKEDVWEFIGSEDGLINTIVEAIVGDNTGNIWVGGVNGLSKITKLED